MQYREDAISGNKLSILGLGCMRFPRDFAETERMVMTAIDKGVNYFDTAYLYPGSEDALGRILEKNGRRKDVYVATKLPLLSCKSADDFDKYFQKSLARLKTDYVDYYLLHMITGTDQWRKFKDWGVIEWAEEKKKSGQIRQFGFSYHGAGKEFLEVLDAYKWDFCQIQYNYSNENYQAGKTGLQAAFAKGIPVIVMEPLLGGKLVTGLPDEARKALSRADSRRTPAEWGLRWLWDQKEVTCVLAGTTNSSQITENILAAERASELSDKELSVYKEVIAVFNKFYKIHCTGCNYCMPCPAGVNIPGCFAAYNASYAQGYTTGIQQFMTGTKILSKKPSGPRKCVKCGKCEKHCPQNLAIMEELGKVARRLEPLPLRAVLSIVRKFM